MMIWRKNATTTSACVHAYDHTGTREIAADYQQNLSDHFVSCVCVFFPPLHRMCVCVCVCMRWSLRDKITPGLCEQWSFERYNVTLARVDERVPIAIHSFRFIRYFVSFCPTDSHFHLFTSIHVVLLFFDILWEAQFKEVFHELQRASSNLLLKCFCASLSDISSTYIYTEKKFNQWTVKYLARSIFPNSKEKEEEEKRNYDDVPKYLLNSWGLFPTIIRVIPLISSWQTTIISDLRVDAEREKLVRSDSEIVEIQLLDLSSFDPCLLHGQNHWSTQRARVHVWIQISL